jgi:hypothetical protein
MMGPTILTTSGAGFSIRPSRAATAPALILVPRSSLLEGMKTGPYEGIYVSSWCWIISVGLSAGRDALKWLLCRTCVVVSFGCVE